MRRHLNVLLLGVLLATGWSCALWQDRAVCAWLELEDMPGLIVTGPRVTNPNYRGATCNGPAGTYAIQRATYSVEIWNGEALGHELYLRAFDPDRTRLRVRGVDLAPIHSTHGITEVTYDRLLDIVGLASGRGTRMSFPATVSFDILDAAGGVVGHESIRLVEKRGSYPVIP
jgi:hypothetical protein